MAASVPGVISMWHLGGLTSLRQVSTASTKVGTVLRRGVERAPEETFVCNPDGRSPMQRQ